MVQRFLLNPTDSKAQPLVGLFDYRYVLLLIALAALLVYQPIVLVTAEFTLAIGLVVFLRSAWLIWPLIALVLPFASDISIGPATLTDCLVTVAIALWFFDGARRKSLKLDFGLPSILLLIFVGFHIALLFIAIDLGEALPEVVKWGEILAVLALMPAMVPAERRQWVISALLLAGSSQALLGIYQFIFQIGHPSFVLMDRSMRASGTFAQPNPYAGYLGSLLPVGVSMGLFSISQMASLNGRMRDAVHTFLFFGVTTALIGVGMIVSWSRGGWLGTLVGVGFVLLFHGRRALRPSIIFGFAVIAIMAVYALNMGLVPSSIQARLGNLYAYTGVNLEEVLNQEVHDDNFAIIERLAHWKAAVLMWEDAMLFGIGPGGYATAYPEVIRLDPHLLNWEEPLGHAHNIYLNFMAEIGLIGLFLYVCMITCIMIWIWRKALRWQSIDTLVSALSVGVLGVLLYVSIHNMFDNLYVKGIYLHLGFWIALLSEKNLSEECSS